MSWFPRNATDRAIEASKQLIHDAFADRKKSLIWAMIQTRRNLMNVKVARTIIKPKVSIIGEFWAMTTEGDGNYGLQRFLWEFWKPYGALIGPLTLFHLLSLFILLYAVVMLATAPAARSSHERAAA